MNKVEEKMKSLLSERETIIAEMNELKRAYDIRQQRLIEITGSINTLQEIVDEENNEETTTEE